MYYLDLACIHALKPKLGSRGAQRNDHLLDKIIDRYIQPFRAAHDILTIDGPREGFILHLLLHSRELNIEDALASAEGTEL